MTRKKPKGSKPSAPADTNAFHKATGAPPKLTPELQEAVCRAIRTGNYVETAAALNGISKKTLYNWFRLGNKNDSAQEYQAFLHAVKEAIALGEARDVMALDKAAHGAPEETRMVPDIDPETKQPRRDPKTGEIILKKQVFAAVAPNWKAAAWRLERKHTKRWGRRDQVKIYDGDETEEEAREFEGGGASHADIMDLLDQFDKEAGDAKEEK